MENILVLALKLLKFCVVGFSGMLIDFALTWLCKEKCKINKYIANSIGFVCAATNNYIWNRLWTFGSTANDIPKEYALFFIISLVGLMLNNLCIYILSDRLKLNFYLSKIIAIGIVTFWNFGMNYFFTFHA